jgi:hypothetical protein
LTLLNHTTKLVSQMLSTDVKVKAVCDAVELLVHEYYDLVALDDEGNWKVLASAVSYEDADHQLDIYTDQFPHAMLDIIPHKNNA